MKTYLFFVLALIAPTIVLAHVPELPVFPSYEEAVVVNDPAVSQAFYAELTGFPHQYEFNVPLNQELFIEVLVPDTDETENNIGGIIVKKKPTGLVDAVAMLDSKAATWESFYEPFGGDSYRRGPSFRGEVEAGDYLVEISTATNMGKYVFVIGEIEDFSEVGIWETMKRIYAVKRFADKPPIAVLQSPFYFVPFGVIAVIVLLLWYRKRKNHA